MNINRMFSANKKGILLVVQNCTAEKKNVIFSIYMYKKKRTEHFTNKKMQQFTVQQGKKIVFTAAKNMVLQCLYVKTGNQKTNTSNCLNEIV